MQGEVSATKRPKNSALEVDLDWERNANPPPDENQSKKGLGEIYADEYAQKTGLVSQALTFSDEQKREASLLFKKLCLKLDALSHFHFTPKPIIEDMSIQTNVPALAMEEVFTFYA
nr:U3 small nucleolar ribonucleoprotein protein MPP10 [Tanacetum cinerariifolium]